MGKVHIRSDGTTAIIAFDNPPLGFLTGEMTGQFHAALTEVLGRDDVRALVLTGETPGVMIRHFDLPELSAMAEAMAADPPTARAKWDDSIFHQITRRLETCDIPVIAAINGDCMGVGFEIALACDIRIAQAGPFSIGLPEMNIAMFPGGGGAVRLARAVGVARALEWIATARVLEPHEALALGLVSHVVADPLAYALAMARDMARRSATGIAAAKRIVHAAQDAGIEDALTIEQQEVNDRLGSDEVREVLRAYAKSGADLRKPIQIRRETNGEL
ncbi:MAG: enoyl-CoA hydratase/isomerase family protein [Steroidobacteraceae bacterium]